MLTGTRTIITCTAAVAAVGLAASIATPALATARQARGGTSAPRGIVAGRGGALRLPSRDHAIGRAAARPLNTRTSAGYQATVRAGSATVLTGSFSMPALSCTAANWAIVPDAVIGVGAKGASASFVFTGCVAGAAVYFPGLVVNGKETDYRKSPFAAGDVIDLTAKVSVNRTRVQVTDVTTGVTQKIIGAGARARFTFIGDDGWLTSPTQLQHVPDFGKLTFKNCLLDGKALASSHPQALQRVNSPGTVQISTGAFWPGGNTFTTRFEHS